MFFSTTKNTLLLAGCWLLSVAAWGQSFRYQAAVKPVATAGYYRLMLPPDVLGTLQDDLGDIRLYDDQNQEVPYLVSRQTGNDATGFVPFIITEKTNVPSAFTQLVINRPDRWPISALGVEMANSGVTKRATLSGSNDGKIWYALAGGLSLGTMSPTRTTVRQTLSIPLNDYPYLRLLINDSTSAPLNIIDVGGFLSTKSLAQFTPIDGVQVTRRDSTDRHTYLLLSRSRPARLDQLVIRVSGATAFQRTVDYGYLTDRAVAGKRRKRLATGQAFQVLSMAAIRSVGPNAAGSRLPGDSIITIRPGAQTTDFCLRIANEDSPPLPPIRIDAAQLTTYLTARLDPTKTYLLRFGNRQITAPDYDLASFRDQLPANVPTASVGSVTNAPSTTLLADTGRNRYWVWGVTGVVLALLGVMTVKLLREK